MEEKMKKVYKDLEHAIETENEEETEKLVNLLAKEKGMTEEIAMPKDFVKQIQRKEGRKIMADKRRILKVVAAGMAAVFAIGGTTYAATHLEFDDLRFVGSGVVAITGDSKDTDIQIYENEDGRNITVSEYEYGEDGNVVSQSAYNATASEETDSENKSVLSDKDREDTLIREAKLEESEIQVIEEQEGTKDTNWSHKVTKLEITPLYSSDDGKNWEKSEESKYRYTAYTYDTWKNFNADKVMPDIINEKAFEGFTLDDSKIVYTEGYMDAKEDMTNQSLEAIYLNGNKKIELNYDIDKDLQQTGENSVSVVSMIIDSDDGKVENQRFYTTKKNVKYALQDVKRDGKKSTSAYLSGNGNSIHVFFTNMSETEIHNILDNIDATALLEKSAK